MSKMPKDRLILLIVLLVVVAGGAGYWFLLKPKADDGTTTAASAPPTNPCPTATTTSGSGAAPVTPVTPQTGATGTPGAAGTAPTPGAPTTTGGAPAGAAATPATPAANTSSGPATPTSGMVNDIGKAKNLANAQSAQLNSENQQAVGSADPARAQALADQGALDHGLDAAGSGAGTGFATDSPGVLVAAGAAPVTPVAPATSATPPAAAPTGAAPAGTPGAAPSTAATPNATPSAAPPAAGAATDANGCPTTTPVSPSTPVGVPTRKKTKKGLKGAAKGAQKAKPVTPVAPLSRAVIAGQSTSSNTPFGLKAASLVSGLLTKNTLNASVEVDLVPGASGVDTRAKGAGAKYRSSVSAVVLRVTFTDATTLQQWDSNTRATRQQSVSSFLTLLHTEFPNATATASVVDSTGQLVAVGDAAPSRAPSVQVLA